MQVTDSWRVSIYNKYADVCMKCMKCMTLIMNMQQGYADDLERQNELLRQQLEGLGIDPYGAGSSTAGTSDYSAQAREWSPWPDTYHYDDPARGWSPWPDTYQQDD